MILLSIALMCIYQSLSIDARSSLQQEIVLTGGGTAIANFKKRLMLELITNWQEQEFNNKEIKLNN